MIGENISNMRFVAWDTETTGASPGNDHLVEIAAIAFDEEFEHRRFESLVKPPVSISHEVTRIHGITDEMVRQAPDASLALERFFEFLGWSGSPRILLAHNAAFDVGMVYGELRRMQSTSVRNIAKGFPPEVVLDTCMLAKALLPDLPQHRVESLARHFGLEFGRLHRALEDVRVLQKIFMNLLGIAADQRVAQGGELTVETLINIAGGYFVLDPKLISSKPKFFKLPPRIEALEPLCGTECRVAISYDDDDNYRYVTPLSIKIKGFRVYIEAFCLRDNIKKTFRADRIKKIGKIEEP